MKPLRALKPIAGVAFIICLLAMASGAPAGASRLGDIPVMEEIAAGLRTIATMDPDEKIRNPDTMAKEFLTPAFWFWTSLDEDFGKVQAIHQILPHECLLHAKRHYQAHRRHPRGSRPETASCRWSSSVPGWTVAPTALQTGYPAYASSK